MVFNLRKKALAPIVDTILPDPGTEEPLFGMDQPMVDMQWETVGKYQFRSQTEMINSYGGIEAMREQINTVKENPNESRNLIDNIELIKNMSDKRKNKMTKSFNLKKAQYGSFESPTDIPGMRDNLNDNSELMGDNLEMQQDVGERKFRDGADVSQWLQNEIDMGGALQFVTRNDISENADIVKQMIEQFYDMLGKPTTEPRDLEVISGQIFDYLPENLKESQGIPAIEKTFQNINNIIKKEAQKAVNKNNKKPFNLIKTAQHKSLDNAILWGPGQSRIDPFLHQPVSDWHIVERNKGFGLVVDDVWNIDYETIWRENIMDKYSRPYKNKEGEWVGGYIQKRFEVDKNIPETSNYQLKPGQLRRPILPEYGNTESRLQAARAAGDIAGANDVSKPFNWKEASKKKS